MSHSEDRGGDGADERDRLERRRESFEREDARLFHDDPDEWDRRHWPLGSTAEPPRG